MGYSGLNCRYTLMGNTKTWLILQCHWFSYHIVRCHYLHAIPQYLGVIFVRSQSFQDLLVTVRSIVSCQHQRICGSFLYLCKRKQKTAYDDNQCIKETCRQKSSQLLYLVPKMRLTIFCPKDVIISIEFVCNIILTQSFHFEEFSRR